MPYKSRAQAAFMHIHHPEVAKRWDKKYGNAGKLPKHVKPAREAAHKKKHGASR